MLSVQPLAGGGGAAGYYLQREAGCEHELEVDRDGLGYYVNEHDGSGRWLGGGAAALGLAGRLGAEGAEVLRGLLDGRLGGEQLARPVLRHADGRTNDVRRGGFDLTFSAPKSVSVLWALADTDVAEQVRQAHAAAVQDALGLVEHLAARAARGHQGDGQRAPRIATSGVIAATFEHQTSRAADPQLHTHVLLINLAQGVDGRWSALDSRTLHRQATTASHLYQHRLRAELTRRLGVGWSEVERGIAEVDGIPLSVRRAFSTRRQQIEQHLEQRGPQPAADGPARRGRAGQLAARVACLATRPAKRHEQPAGQRQRWRATADRLGFSANTVQLDHHGFVGWSVGLRPVVVAGSFDVPLGVLAFNDAGIGPKASPR